MSLSRVKTWVAGEVLTASDLNSEFNNILNNPVSLISPLTGALDFDGYTVTLDAAGVTQVNSTAAVSWNFTSGAKTGTPATTGSIANYSAQTFTDSATAGSGTAAAWVGYAIQRPTLAATNASVTTTNAATVYIPNAPAAGTNQTITNPMALWVDDGATRLDGNLTVGGNAAVTGAALFTAGIGPNYLQNIGITATVASKALTVAITTKANATPTATDYFQIDFRNVTLTTGNTVTRNGVAATSVVAPSGATLGFAAAATGYVYVYALDNAGTPEAIISGSNHWDEGTVQSTTAISATADSGSVLYSTTARTNVPIRYIGRIKIQTGAVAGEWDNEDTEITLSSDLRGSSQGMAVASASTTDIWNGGNSCHITGTTTINSLGTAPYAGAMKLITFDGILTLTHGTLDLPGSANITTAAGDFCVAYANTKTDIDIISYTRNDGTPLALAANSVSLSKRKTRTVNALADAEQTLGSPEVASEVIFTIPASANKNLTMPTAANIIANLPSDYTTGTCFELTIVGTAAGTITVLTNADVTLTGNMVSAAGGSLTLICRVASGTTITVYRK